MIPFAMSCSTILINFSFNSPIWFENKDTPFPKIWGWGVTYIWVKKSTNLLLTIPPPMTKHFYDLMFSMIFFGSSLRCIMIGLRPWSSFGKVLNVWDPMIMGNPIVCFLNNERSCDQSVTSKLLRAIYPSTVVAAINIISNIIVFQQRLQPDLKDQHMS